MVNYDEVAWQIAPKSPRFVDVISGAPGIYETHAALLWDDHYLYIGFWCEEPYVQAHLTERDSIVFSENDVEVFIDGGDTYYEFEINARNTIYEVFYIWKDAYVKGGKYDIPEFDLFEQNALVFGGNHDRSLNHFWHGSHPRGNRWVFTNWDLPGLKTAVAINGRINNAVQPDKGWTVELAFPWTGMGWLANGRPLPPQDGDTWRLFLGRYEKFNMNGNDIYTGWAWNRIGSADNHFPERFTRIQFSDTEIESL